MNIVFAGTPEFARASLTALLDFGRVPVAVLTQPDRPAGRGRKLTASPVKQCAQAHGIPVLQPATLRDDQAVAELAALQPDLLIVAAYGLILPQKVLDIPTHGCLNVHASVLPRWRGAAPIQAAILAGDVTTGISLMAMTAGLDCGPVYHVETIDIGAQETAGELHDRLALLGGRALIEQLEAIVAGEIVAAEQDDALATHAPKIEKADAEIDWALSAADVARRVRAYNPFPGAFTHCSSDRIKVWRGSETQGTGEPGAVLQFDRDGIIVACGNAALRLEELQLPGKRRATAQEFLGQADLAGQRLG
ncbi:MAG: methionyl-tRNA formyltransferase [Gammaproteobacteria bacterium]|nr:methionyl-tRNA formyltransferase [Gammaproteobacteria bacterium]